MDTSIHKNYLFVKSNLPVNRIVTRITFLVWNGYLTYHASSYGNKIWRLIIFGGYRCKNFILICTHYSVSFKDVGLFKVLYIISFHKKDVKFYYVRVCSVDKMCKLDFTHALQNFLSLIIYNLDH